jgi:trans-aconitate methyltransferase
MNIVKKGWKSLKEEGIRTFLSKTWRYTTAKLNLRSQNGWIGGKFRDQIIGYLYKKGVLEADQLYTDYYYEELKESHQEDYERFIDIIVDRFAPDSLVDFGCGPAKMLEESYKRGIQVLGLDINKAGFDETDLSDKMFKQADLTQYVQAGTFDIALCIEVLEHIPESSSDYIVDSLCDASPVVIVTAAPPDQGGTHHFNEQPKTYWENKFSERNYRRDKKDEQHISERLALPDNHYLVNNLMVYKEDFGN